MGLENYLSSILSAIGGSPSNTQVIPQQPTASAPPQQQPAPSGTAPSAAAAPPPASMLQPQTGIAGFLANPLTQGALSAYFSALRTPKAAGRDAVIADAGLGGLSGYSEAQRNKLQLPLLAAQIQNMQSQTGLRGAQTGLAQAHAQQLSGIQQANAQLASQIKQIEPQLSSTQQTRAEVLANSIANDTSKVYDPKEVFQQIYEEPLKEQLTSAQIGASGARTGLEEAQTAAVPARTAATTAEAAASTSRAATANAALNNPVKLGQMYANELEKAKATYMKANPPPSGWNPFADKTGYTDKMNAAAKAQADAVLNKFGLSGAASLSGAGGRGTLPEGLPPGATDNGDGTFTLEDGTILAPADE